MKRFVFFIAFFSVFAHAQTYIDFDKFIHAKQVHIHPGQSLQEVLRKHNYDLAKKTWVKITMLMNGMVKPRVLENEKSKKIFLPPKLTFQEYLADNKREIAGQKPYCSPISRQLLIKRFGKEIIPYIDYFDLITSRKINVKKGENLETLISRDQFDYGSIARGAKVVQLANGLPSKVVDKNRTIYLPFCANSDLERKIASTPQTVAPLPQAPVKVSEKSDVTLSAEIVYGNVEVSRDATSLSMSITKLKGASVYRASPDFSVSGYVSAAMFTEVNHSDAANSASPESFYPELGVSVGRYFEGWSASVAYDMLNYFVVGQEGANITLEPTVLHRASIKPYLPLNDNFGVFGSVGYLDSLGGLDVGGTDYSAGVVYAFGERKRFKISALAYGAELTTNASSSGESSKAYIGALSFSL